MRGYCFEKYWVQIHRFQHAYQQFLDVFGPLQAQLGERFAPSPLEALLLRTLAIHEYRRVLLRDPVSSRNSA